jgi:RNA polymerase sigma factor (sigma-70 family)
VRGGCYARSSVEPPVAPVFPVEMRTRLARRDPAALALFFDAFFDRVFAYLRRLVGDEHLAEDLTQDVFLQAQRALGSYDPARDPRPWLFTIATNKLRDHWRARAAHGGSSEASLDHEELGERVLAFQQPPDQLTSSEETTTRVRAAIDALPEGLRAPVLLRVYEGLSFEDIGRIIERNEVAARKRYSRALGALRGSLGGLWKQSLEGRR